MVTGDNQSEIPEYDDKKHEDILRQTIKELLEGYETQTAIAKSLSAFISKNKERLKIKRAWNLDQRHISNFKLNNSDQIKSADLRFAMWAWLWSSDFHRKFVKKWFDRFEEVQTGVGKLPETYNAFLNKGTTLDLTALQSLEGRFAFYRPYFDNPKKIMVGELLFGVENDLSKFSLEMRHPFPSGNLDTDHVVGHGIPHGRKILLQGKFIGWNNGPFIASMRMMQHSRPKIERADGVLLASASDYNPISSAVLMIRANEKVNAGVFNISDFDQNTQPQLKDIIKKGMVDWK